jgi:hypothetical protein
MVKKIDIKPAVLDSGTTVSVQILKYIDGELSEDNTYTFDANDLEVSRASSNTYVAKIVFGTAYTEWIDGSTTQCFFDGVVCSPNDAYTLAGLVEADVTAFASGGGSYTFPSNSGNTAYVSSGGNDGTGVVGNISKPFLTADGAIAALTTAGGTDDATVVILSSSVTIEITDYDYTTMPYNLDFHVLCPSDVSIEGNCSFGLLRLKTQGLVYANPAMLCATDESWYIECGAFIVPATANGSLEVSGTINCNTFLVLANVNIVCDFDTVVWRTSCNIETVGGFNYVKINPRIWEGKISQVDTDPPTIDAVIENTINGTITTGYNNVGEYELICAGAFIPGFTSVDFGNINVVAIAQYGSALQGTITTEKVPVFAFDAFNAAANNILLATDVTIKIYPEKY